MNLPCAGSATEAYIAAYLAAGWSLFPVRPKDKRPLAEALPAGVDGKPSWLPYQQRQPAADEVRAWLRGWPDMNLGVVTGQVSGLAVLDLDGEDAVRAVRDAGVSTPPTLLQRTPHGVHAFYRLNGTPVRNATGLLPRVDVRGEGGYVVVAPSRLADGQYRWLNAADLAPVPKWLEEGRVQPATPRDASTAAADAPGWVKHALEQGAARGQRNAIATRLAGFFHSRGVPRDVIAAILQPFAAKCQPPMDGRELAAVVDSVGRYAVRARTVGVTEPPTFLEVADGYRYEWETAGVQMELRSFHAERDGGLSCELVVENTLPGLPQRLYGPVRFNLLSVSTRNQLVTALDRRLKEVEWAQLLDDIARLAVETYRAGEPAILLRDAVAPAQAGGLLPPLVPTDGPTILFADGGTGKSLLALAAAASIASGTDVGLGITPTLRKRVLWLDWEWDPWQHRERLRRLIGEQQLAHCDIVYRRCFGPLTDQVLSLRRLIAVEEIGFGVVDSVAPACGGEPEAAAVALGFFDALRSLRLEWLLTAHTNRGGDDQKPFGSAFWHDMARCTWFVAKVQAEGEDVLHLGLYNRKLNVGRKELPLGYRIDFSGDAIAMHREELTRVAGLAEKLPLAARMEGALRRGARPVSALATELGISEATARTTLNRLAERGKARRLPEDGSRQVLWGLAETHERPA